MRFYINRFGNGDSGKQFGNYDDFMEEIARLVAEAVDNSEEAFEVLYDSGEDGSDE